MQPLSRSAVALALAALPLAWGCPRADRPPAAGRPLLVFAAASLGDALAEIGVAFTAAGGPEVDFSFAGSSTLARQIAAGAPADAFLSADRAQVEALVTAGKVAQGAPRRLFGNQLVVAVPAAARPLSAPADLLAFDRVALADPAAGVPAGVYARAWLERERLWSALAPKVVPTLDVRAALAAVAAGNVPAAIVYSTDAESSERVRVGFRVPLERAPEIAYWGAPVGSAPRPEAVRFLGYVAGPSGREILARWGFAVGSAAAGGGG